MKGFRLWQLTLGLLAMGVFHPLFAAFDIEQKPLFMGVVPVPNVMITLDDSRTMGWDYMPEKLNDLLSKDYYNELLPIYPVNGQEVYFSAQTNSLYYDPRVTYRPWVKTSLDPAGEVVECPNAPPTKIPVDAQGFPVGAARWLCKNGSGYSDTAAPSGFDHLVNLAIPETRKGSYPKSYDYYPIYYIYLGDWIWSQLVEVNSSTTCISPSGYQVTPQVPDVCSPSSYFPVVLSQNPLNQSAYSYADLLQNKANFYSYHQSTWAVLHPAPASIPMPNEALWLNLDSIMASTVLANAEDRSLRLDCANGSCSYQQELQNYANWYVYHSTPVNNARDAAGRAVAETFIKAKHPVRLGFALSSWTGKTDTGSINTTATKNWQALNSKVVLGVRSLTDTSQTVNQTEVDAFFYDYLYCEFPDAVAGCQVGGSKALDTDLRKLLYDVGGYFQKTDNTGPWSDDPVSQSANQLACRQSFNIILSDGQSSGTADLSALTNANQNVDGIQGPVYTSYELNRTVSNAAVNPYQDGYSATLADYAMYFYQQDLHPGLANYLPSSYTGYVYDEAFWQHLVNYTVGMGIPGTLVPDNATLDKLTAGDLNWPDPQGGTAKVHAEKADDLWHAAVNSRGAFYSGSSPDALTKQLNEVVGDIVGSSVTASGTQVATNSGRLQQGLVVYQTKFRASDWSGQLLAFQLNADGSFVDTDNNGVIDEKDALWDAGKKLGERLKGKTVAWIDANRPMYSWNYFQNLLNGNWLPHKAIKFDASFFSDNQFSSFGGNAGPDYVDYLKGDSSKEKSAQNPTGTQRSRTVVAADGTTEFRPLGDIINSNPLFVGQEDYGYSSLPGLEGGSYAAFLATKASRLDMLYVGANDGIFHGFSAADGEEKLAYVPGVAIDQALASRVIQNPLQHQYIVDGSPAAGDAYWGGNWHTVVLSTTGGASPSMSWTANAVFALDVTDPLQFGIPKILWEFNSNDVDGYDLGQMLGQPVVAKMQNGQWLAVVANGYNSDWTSGASMPVLYLLDLSKKPCRQGNFGESDCDPGFIVKKFYPCPAASDACLDPYTGNINNGLSAPITVDVDGDKRVDYIYAGDLLGNLWKFDVTCPAFHDPATGALISRTADDTACTAADWKMANMDGATPKPLFTACAPEADGTVNVANCKTDPAKRQPITEKPQVIMAGMAQTSYLLNNGQSNSSMMVLFGSGKYLEKNDVLLGNDTPIQSLYGIWDQNRVDKHGVTLVDNAVSDRTALKSHCVLDPAQAGNQCIGLRQANDAGSFKKAADAALRLRITSDGSPCYDAQCCAATNAAGVCTSYVNQQKGWYLDLPVNGERSINSPSILNGNAIFTTLIPSDPCLAGGSSWIMEIEAITGARSVTPILDVWGPGSGTDRRDSVFDSNDMVLYAGKEIAVSGLKSEVGILGAPAMVYGKNAAGQGGVMKIFTGSSGSMMLDKKNQGEWDKGQSLGRISWRQLR